jgi:hypothetical protein
VNIELNLGFSWLKDGVHIFYKFLVLPFGLTSACYLFTKITRSLVKKWRSEGKPDGGTE